MTYRYNKNFASDIFTETKNHNKTIWMNWTMMSQFSCYTETLCTLTYILSHSKHTASQIWTQTYTVQNKILKLGFLTNPKSHVFRASIKMTYNKNSAFDIFTKTKMKNHNKTIWMNWTMMFLHRNTLNTTYILSHCKQGRSQKLHVGKGAGGRGLILLLSASVSYVYLPRRSTPFPPPYHFRSTFGRHIILVDILVMLYCNKSLCLHGPFVSFLI